MAAAAAAAAGDVGAGKGLFSDEVATILTTSVLGDPLTIAELGGVTYSVDPDGSRMRAGASKGTFEIVDITSRKTAREALLNASIGSLLNRQEMYGALLRYPRTLVLGPDAAFACTEPTAALGLAKLVSQWDVDVSAKPSTAADGTAISVRDFDQIIWVNHCAEERGTVTGAKSAPTVAINVAFFDHATRSVSKLGVTLHRATFAGTEAFNGFDQKIDDQFAAVMANLGAPSIPRDSTSTTAGYKYRLFAPSDTRVAIMRGQDGGDTPTYDLEYVKYAVAALERVMRGSVFSPEWRRRAVSELLEDTHNEYGGHPELVYTAVLSGVVPYGITDIADAKDLRPAPIPGAAPAERIVGVMRHLLGYKLPEAESFSAARFADDAASSPAYGALASAMRADRASRAADDNVSPYALVSASLARNAAEATAMRDNDPGLGLGLGLGFGLDEDDMSSSDDDDPGLSLGIGLGLAEDDMSSSDDDGDDCSSDF